MVISFAEDHRSSTGLRLTVAARKTPLSVPTRFSPDRMSNPSQIPSLQTSSNLPGMSFVLGILKCVSSPSSHSLAFDLRPFMT